MQTQATPSFAIFDDYRPIVGVAVVVRWVLLLTYIALLQYRIDRDTSWVVLNLMGGSLAVINGYVTWRILSRRPITWHYALALGLADLTMITVGLFLRGGLQNGFYVFYYPALLGLSLMFPKRASFSALIAVIGLYILMAFTISPTLNYDLQQEKVLIVRIITMVGIVVAGTLITGWERTRRREAVAAERERAEENLELQRKAQQAELAEVEERSRIAQSIYMLSLHLETSADLARQERQDLTERLDGLVVLSKETLLEVRHYIFDLKPYLAGEKGLADMVENQVREFNMIAGVPTTLETMGEERQVPVQVATCLYRVTQEALSNAFKHAGASKVKVSLEFAKDGVQFIVQDDGRGFNASSSMSGHGLGNMRQRAEGWGVALA